MITAIISIYVYRKVIAKPAEPAGGQDERRIRINGEDMPQPVVKSRFLKLDSGHIDYVLQSERERRENLYHGSAEIRQNRPADG